METLRQLLGQAAAKRGIFEGDLDGGELEIGQIASAINEIVPVATIMKRLDEEYLRAKALLI